MNDPSQGVTILVDGIICQGDLKFIDLGITKSLNDARLILSILLRQAGGFIIGEKVQIRANRIHFSVCHPQNQCFDYGHFIRFVISRVEDFAQSNDAEEIEEISALRGRGSLELDTGERIIKFSTGVRASATQPDMNVMIEDVADIYLIKTKGADYLIDNNTNLQPGTRLKVKSRATRKLTAHYLEPTRSRDLFNDSNDDDRRSGPPAKPSREP